MAYPEDPDFGPLHQLAAGVVADPSSRKLYAEAETLGATVTSIAGNASGRTIDSACEGLVLAKAAATLSGDNLTIVEAAIVGLNTAALMWEGMRPGPDWKAYLDKLEQDLTTANDAVATAAQEWDDAETETEDAKAKEDYGVAAKAQKAAHDALMAAVQDRQAADKAYEDLRARVATGLADGIEVAPDDTDGGTVLTRPGDDTGDDNPDRTNLNGVTPTGTPAPAGTPASPGTTTPPAANPGETPTETGDPNKLTDADIAALASLAQTPAAAGTPAATTPAATTPQPATDNKDGKPTTPEMDPLSIEDFQEAGLLPDTSLAAVAGLSGVPARNSKVTPAVTPAAPAAAPTPAPVAATTSGMSLSGLSTQSDVSGKATPPANAFTAPAAETKTSAATGNQTAANPMGTRPGGGQMMPPMAHVPGAAAAAPSGGNRAADGEKKNPILVHDPLFGGTAIGEAVRGGTIAQRRDKDDQTK